MSFFLNVDKFLKFGAPSRYYKGATKFVTKFIIQQPVEMNDPHIKVCTCKKDNKGLSMSIKDIYIFSLDI